MKVLHTALRRGVNQLNIKITMMRTQCQ